MPPPAHTPLASVSHIANLPSTPAILPQPLLDHIDLTTRILSLVDNNLIHDINQFVGFLPALDQLAAQVRSELARVRSHLEDLKLQVDDLRKAKDRAAALILVSKLESHLTVLSSFLS